MLVFDLSLNHILSVLVATIVGLVTSFVLFELALKSRYLEAIGKTWDELQPGPKNLLVFIGFLYLEASAIGWVLNNVGAANLLDAVIIGVVFWAFLLWFPISEVIFEKYYNYKAFSIIALATFITTVLMSVTIKIVGDLMLI